MRCEALAVVASHTVAAIGCHSANSATTTPLESITYVVRSIDAGTKPTHQRLNPGRAISECWSAKSRMSSASTDAASPIGGAVPESTDFGTPKFARKPIK